MSPPTESIAVAISRADRSGVPLKSRCSRKWEAPARAGGSSTEPVPTQNPMLTERTSVISSVTTVRPPSTAVHRCRTGSLAPTGVAPRGTLRTATLGTRRGRAEVVECGSRFRLPAVLEGHLGSRIDTSRRRAPVARRLGTGGLGRLAGKRERHLPLRVDVLDAHLQLVAEVDDVLDLLHPPAATQLRNVEQAVASGEDVDERPELGDVDDLAGVNGADLRLWRVEDHLDPAPGLRYRPPVTTSDGDRAHHPVVVDGDVRARFELEGVDHLALGAYDLADLLDWDLQADDLRGGVAHLAARLGNRLGHDREDLRSGFVGLAKCCGKHVGGEAVDLGVELQRRHEVGGARYLEVHVAEGVLRAEDVGQGDVLLANLDQAHGYSCHRCLDRHPGVHERQCRRADRRHRRRAVGREHLRNETQGVRELLDGRHHRQQGPLGQQAVTDLAALGAADSAGFAVGEGRHVVVVHVALLLVDADGVEELVHAGHPRVATFSTCVSPRWKSPLPWAVGTMPTAAYRGRMSDGLRPSIRTPDDAMRWRTIFLVNERTAALISASRPGNSSPSSATMEADTSSVAASRSALAVIVVTLSTLAVPTSATRAATSSP